MREADAWENKMAWRRSWEEVREGRVERMDRSHGSASEGWEKGQNQSKPVMVEWLERNWLQTGSALGLVVREARRAVEFADEMAAEGKRVARAERMEVEGSTRRRAAERK